MKNSLKTVKKVVMFIVGIFINALGIVLITKTNLGTAQISSIAYVVSLSYSSISFGMATFLLNVSFIIMQLIILKGKMNFELLLQLPVSFLLGFFISVYMRLFSGLMLDGMLLKLAILLLGCIILAFGISVEIAPDIVKIPGKGIVYLISKKN